MNRNSIIYETWKDIPNYEDIYEISTRGYIKSISRWRDNGKSGYLQKEKYMTPHVTKKGYLAIDLYKDKKRKKYLVHRLIAETFIPNPNNYPCVNHKDGNKLNNDINNLEWCTQQYNMKEAARLGLLNLWCDKLFGKDHPNYKFRGKWKTQKPIYQFDINGVFIKRYNSSQEANRETDINASHISECCNNKRKTAGGFIWKFEKEEQNGKVEKEK